MFLVGAAFMQVFLSTQLHDVQGLITRLGWERVDLVGKESKSAQKKDKKLETQIASLTKRAESLSEYLKGYDKLVEEGAKAAAPFGSISDGGAMV